MDSKEEGNNKISRIIVFLFTIAILSNLLSFLKGIVETMNGGKMIVNGNLIENMGLSIYGTIVSALTIIILVLILAKKKIGVISFYALSILNMFVMYMLAGGDFFTYLIATLVHCVVMTGLLFIRCNKRSAWNVIFYKEGRK